VGNLGKTKHVSSIQSGGNFQNSGPPTPVPYASLPGCCWEWAGGFRGCHDVIFGSGYPPQKAVKTATCTAGWYSFPPNKMSFNQQCLGGIYEKQFWFRKWPKKWPSKKIKNCRWKLNELVIKPSSYGNLSHNAFLVFSEARIELTYAFWVGWFKPRGRELGSSVGVL
jgi:hypothetical protein